MNESVAAIEEPFASPAAAPRTVPLPAAPARVEPPLTLRLLRGGTWAVFGKTWNALLIVAANALLARLLSLADFAAFLLAFSCVTILGTVGTLGLNVSVVRYIAESLSMDDQQRARQVVVRSWLLALGGGMAMAAGLGTALWSAGTYLRPLAPLMSVASLVVGWIVVHSLSVMQGESFRGFHKIGPASIFGTPYNLPFLAGLSWLAIGGSADLSTVLRLVLACQVINLLIGCVYLASPLVAGRRHASASPAACCSVGWLEMLRESLPLAVTAATSLLMAQLDLWIVAALCSTTDLAIYGAVTRLMLLVSMPVNIVNAFVPPLIADLYTRGQRRELEDMLRCTATLTSLPALAAFLFVLAASGSLLALFYGEPYRPGADLLIVLSLGQLINAWCGPAGSALSMTHRQTSAMLAVVFSGLILVSLGTWAAHVAGVLGVAWASAGAIALQKILLCWLVWRLLGIRAFGTLHTGSLLPSRRHE